MMAEDTATRIYFPYCRRCIEHVSIAEAGSMTSAVLTLAGIVGGISVGLADSVWHGLFVFVAAITLALFVVSMIQSRARTRCMASCSCAGTAVTFYGWSGSTSTFAFESATYTARFAELNVAQLVSVDPRLRSLLEAHKIARLQVPTPAAAMRTVPPPRDLKEWIAHLERQPGRVARRTALTRALDVVYDEDERRTLVQTACRAELVPLLERIDGLAASTKQRHLRRAIAEVRADNLPEPLREAELSALTARLTKPES